MISALVKKGAIVDPGYWTVWFQKGRTQDDDASIAVPLPPCSWRLRSLARLSHTPLTYAISELDSLAVVNALLEGGADVNAKGVEGLTPLMVASLSSSSSSEAIVRRLLSVKGIAVDERASTDTYFAGRTALSMASNSIIIFLLVEAGADVNSRDNMSWTPLMHAVGAPTSSPSLPAIYALLECGADPKARAANNRTVLMMRPDDLDVISALTYYGATSDDVDGYGMNALMHAADMFHCLGGGAYSWCYNDSVVASALIDNISRSTNIQSFVNCAHTITGKTALMSAPSAAFVRVLLDTGASIDQRDVCGVTALMYAAFYPHKESVTRELIRAGADVNARDDRGQTPLMYATCNRGATRVLLSDPRTDVNAQDERGCTALMLAVAENQFEVVDTILTMRSQRIDMSATTIDDGATVMNLAAQHGHVDILSRLLRYVDMRS